MDGRRRLAEPVTNGAYGRLATGAKPGRLRRARARVMVAYGDFDRRLDRWLGPVLSWRIPRGTGIMATAALVFLSIGFGVVRGGHLQAVTSELTDIADSAANAVGFGITSLALTGQRQLTREDILASAGITGRTSLLFLDAASARTRLKANPWIAEATVLKLYPGRLHIAVTERDAFALWQQNGKISVIADDGTVVEQQVSTPFATLPLVVGAGAGARAKEFLAVLDKYPLIRKQLHAVVLVAERRWNVVLTSGISVRLPEDDVEGALDRLIQLDRDKKLLTRDITAVDLRLPDRLTVRLSDEAYAARQEVLRGQKTKKKAGAA
jgi:cell division protein FtsQ